MSNGLNPDRNGEAREHNMGGTMVTGQCRVPAGRQYIMDLQGQWVEVLGLREQAWLPFTDKSIAAGF